MIAAVLLLALPQAAAADPHVVDVDYEVALPAPPEPLAVVTLRVRGAREQLVLNAVERYAFTALPEPLLEGPLRAEDAAGGALAVRRDGPHQWTLPDLPASAREDGVTLRWRVPLTHRELEAVRANHDQYEFPYVAEDHALLSAGPLLFAPTNAALGDVRVRFELPDGWGVVAPWPEVEPGVFAPPGRRGLGDDLIAVGAWRTHLVVAEDDTGRTEIAVALAPGQEALEEHVVGVVDPIVRAELELFGTRPFERYLFVFARHEIQGFGGSAKASSMTLSARPDTPPERLTGSLAHLVAHEFHHTWPGGRGVPTPGSLRFVGEGFTDYYAYLVPARLGLLPWEELAAAFRRKLDGVRANAGWAATSLSAAGGDAFFQRGDTYRLVYDGGLLCALWLDLELRAADHDELPDLDALMRAFVNDAPADELPSLERLAALAGRALGPDGRAALERFATGTRGDLSAELARVDAFLDQDPAAVGARLALR